MALKKIGLVTASAICSINLWTGAPLFAVWVGSKVQGNLNSLSMTAFFSVIVVLAALVFLLAWALTWINAKYDDVTRRHPEARYTSPWLRSLRDERESSLVGAPVEVPDPLAGHSPAALPRESHTGPPGTLGRPHRLSGFEAWLAADSGHSSGLDRPPSPRLGLRREEEGLCFAHIRRRGFASLCASWEPAPCL